MCFYAADTQWSDLPVRPTGKREGLKLKRSTRRRFDRSRAASNRTAPNGNLATTLIAASEGSRAALEVLLGVLGAAGTVALRG